MNARLALTGLSCLAALTLLVTWWVYGDVGQEGSGVAPIDSQTVPVFDDVDREVGAISTSPFSDPTEANDTPLSENGPPAANALEPEVKRCTVTVRVVDADLKVVVGASVAVATGLSRNPAWVAKPDERAATDQHGVCQFDLAMGWYTFEATEITSGSSALRSFFLSPETKTEEVLIQLNAAAILKVLVLDPEDSPVEGAFVLVRSSGFGIGAGITGPGAAKSVLTDSHGRFTATLGGGGRYSIHVRKGERSTRQRRFSIRSGETKEVTLRFRGACQIIGIVRDPKGNPVAGARVDAWGVPDAAPIDDGLDAELHARGKTDAGGRFSIPIPSPRRYGVIAAARGFCNSRKLEVTIDGANREVAVEVALLPPESIGGRVLDEHGEALAGIYLVASPEVEANESFRRDIPYGRDLFNQTTAHTDDVGRFRFEPIHPDVSYRVLVFPYVGDRRYRISRTGIKPGTRGLEIRLTELERLGTFIRGVVVSGDSGEPITAFKLRVYGERQDGKYYGEGRDREFTDAEGRFCIKPLLPGRQYYLKVRSPSRELASVITGKWLLVPDGIDARIVLPRPGSVAVTVVDSSGSPLSFVKVAVLQVDPEDYFNNRHARCDEGGACTIQGLGPAQYRVKVVGQGIVNEGELIDVAPGSTLTVRLVVTNRSH